MYILGSLKDELLRKLAQINTYEEELWDFSSKVRNNGRIKTDPVKGFEFAAHHVLKTLGNSQNTSEESYRKLASALQKSWLHQISSELIQYAGESR